MYIHFSILILIIVLSLCFHLKDEIASSSKKQRICWMIFLGYLSVLAGIRSYGMNDTGEYIRSFEKLTIEWKDIIYVLNVGNKVNNRVYTLIIYFIRLFTNNYTIFFFVFAVLQSFFLYLTFSKYSYSFPVASFYIYASQLYGCYFSLMRQWLAIAIVFGGLSLLSQKKYLKYLIVMIVAGLIHQSAFCFIPIMFLAEFNIKKINVITRFFLVIIISVIFIILFKEISDNITFGSYDYVLEAMSLNKGSSILRFWVSLVLVIFIIFERNKIVNSGNNFIFICSTCVIIKSAIVLIATFTSGLYLIRMSMYLEPMCAIMYSWLLSYESIHITDDLLSIKLVRKIYYIFYLVYYIILMNNASIWEYHSIFK